MKYRIARVFSVNPETGFPENNYMLQEKRFLKPWRDVQMFVLEQDAEKAKEIREKR